VFPRDKYLLIASTHCPAVSGLQWTSWTTSPRAGWRQSRKNFDFSSQWKGTYMATGVVSGIVTFPVSRIGRAIPSFKVDAGLATANSWV
jgi:hypothetical protein